MTRIITILTSLISFSVFVFYQYLCAGLSLSESISSASEAQKDISKFISIVRKTDEGESLQLSILRNNDDAKIMSAIKPTDLLRGDSGTGTMKSSNSRKIPLDIMVQPKRVIDERGNPTGTMSIGVLLSPNYLKTELVKGNSVGDAFLKAGGAVNQITSATARSLLELLGGVLSGSMDGRSVSGPIGVIKAGSDVVSTNDSRAVIAFAAAISINLAVVNSLPLPALDGGQLAFILAEAVSGKKINQRLQEEINAAVLLLLLVTSFSTAIGDVQALTLGR